MGRPYMLPPGVPPDRVKALRTSFMQTMRDLNFVAEAQKLNLVVDPSDHVDMEKMIDFTYSIPDNIVRKAKNLIDAAPGDASATE